MNRTASATDSELFAIEGLSFAYGQTVVLEGIDLKLSPGRFYGLVGPNGCGKTTFLDLLVGCKEPRGGTVRFRGRPLAVYGRRELARQLALVPQEFDTGFGFTVEEIVMMGRHPHIDRFASPSPADWQAIERALSAIGIAGLRHRYTNTLSGGQKQRTVVARALAQETPVILFDEATASLDIKYTLQIFDLARKLVRDEKKTVIAVIHNLNLAAAYCDHLVFMKDGRLWRQGPTSSTMTAETIAEVFGVVSQVSRDPFNQTLQVSYQYGSTR
jgi:iron complex transport system ATP-binding protein